MINVKSNTLKSLISEYNLGFVIPEAYNEDVVVYSEFDDSEAKAIHKQIQSYMNTAVNILKGQGTGISWKVLQQYQLPNTLKAYIHGTSSGSRHGNIVKEYNELTFFWYYVHSFQFLRGVGYSLDDISDKDYYGLIPRFYFGQSQVISDWEFRLRLSPLNIRCVLDEMKYYYSKEREVSYE